MADSFNKSTARNIYYGGGLFFLLLLVGLTVDTMYRLPERDHRENITESVAHGKHLWENNNCIGCHSLMGEGSITSGGDAVFYLRPDTVRGTDTVRSDHGAAVYCRGFSVPLYPF